MPLTKVTKNEIEDQEAWKTPALVSGWSDYDSVEWFGPRYMKDNIGFVHLKGLIKNTSGATKGGGAVMFTLPAGYRPNHRQRFTAYAVGSSGGMAHQIDIEASGNVHSPSAAIPNTEWASLSGITFRAEQ